MKRIIVCLLPFVLCSCNPKMKDKNDKPTLEKITSVQNKIYTTGDSFSKDDIMVHAYYSDGSEKTITNFTCSKNDGEILKLSNNETVIVEYSEEEKTATSSFDLRVNPYYNIDIENIRNSFKNPIIIEPMDGVTIDNNEHTITFEPASEKTEYTISGYFKGMLINKTKNTELTFNNAFIENECKSCIYAEIKTCVSFKNETSNYIYMTGTDPDEIYTAAFQVKKKNIEIGGKGTCYFVSEKSQVVKGDEIEMKGSGNFYFFGNRENSVISCNNFKVEEEKSFNAYVCQGKNGIKADEGIEINSGNFFLSDNKTALKVDKSEDPASQYEIKLNSGTFNLHCNENFYEPSEDIYTQSSTVIINNF